MAGILSQVPCSQGGRTLIISQNCFSGAHRGVAYRNSPRQQNPPPSGCPFLLPFPERITVGRRLHSVMKRKKTFVTLKYVSNAQMRQRKCP